jgi:hypothetical protein
VCSLLRRLRSSLRCVQFQHVNHNGSSIGAIPRRWDELHGTFSFRNLMPNLAQLTALHGLTITGCVLACGLGSSAANFAAVLVQVTSLTTLELTSNQVRGGIRIVVQALGQLPQLAALLLLDNDGQGRLAHPGVASDAQPHPPAPERLAVFQPI